MIRTLGMMFIAGVAALAVAAIAARSASGHGAAIRLGAQAVAAGDSLAVTGEGLGENAEVTLVLEGVAGTRPLMTLASDAHGRFTIWIGIPGDIPPGAYRVVATAGEDRATADLLVTAGSATVETAGAHGLHAPGEATDQELDLDRRRGPLEIGVAWATVVILIGVGAWLARTPRTE